MKAPIEILKFVSDRISKSWKTTVFGSLIFIAGICTMLFSDSFTLQWWESLIIMLVGVYLASMKDPKDNNPVIPGKAAMLIFIVVSSSFYSCATKKRCISLYGTATTIIVKDSIIKETITEYKDSIINVPGDSVFISLPSPCDSLGNLIKGYQHEIKSSSKAFARIIAKDNRLLVECGCEDEKLKIERLTTVIKQLEKHQKITEKVITMHDKYIPWYCQWYMFLIVFVVAWLDGRFKIFKKLIKLII